MILLALDTSTDCLVIALMDRTGEVRVTTTDAGRRHGRDLIPRLKGLLESAAIAPRELEAIAIGLGPGSYTGTRVGVTAAKTLAYVTGAALIGLNSLHAIARNAPADASRVWAVADAQRGEVYVAEMVRPTPAQPLVPVGETRIEALSDWLARLEPGGVVLGPALTVPRVRAAVPAAFLPPEEEILYARGENLVAAAVEAMAAGRRDNPWLLEPLYLRRSAAEDQWDRRRAAPPG